VRDRSVSLFTNTPMTGETVLVVEVADASLRNDLGLKAALFARTGVPEFRVLDVNGRKLYAHRGPDDGGYGEIRVFSADETLSPVSMPDAVVRIADLLPPLRSAI
jgi:Uma2 family endonuclease